MKSTNIGSVEHISTSDCNVSLISEEIVSSNHFLSAVSVNLYEEKFDKISDYNLY